MLHFVGPEYFIHRAKNVGCLSTRLLFCPSETSSGGSRPRNKGGEGPVLKNVRPFCSFMRLGHLHAGLGFGPKVRGGPGPHGPLHD